MSPNLLEKIVDLAAELLKELKKVDREKLDAAIEKAKSTGGDTSDIERLFS